jgi:hypothetical protein
MRTFKDSLIAGGAASLVLAAATACSSTSALPSAGSAPALGGASSRIGSAAPDKKAAKALLFAADFENSEVLVFDQATKAKKKSPSPIYTITNGIAQPSGIATDESGNLYVANGYSNAVTIYAPGSKTPKATITTGINDPTDVAVDGGGNVYVSNQPLYGSSAYISLYPAGQTSPSYTWYPPVSNMEILGITLIDPTQNGGSSLYAAVDKPEGSEELGDVIDCSPIFTTCIDSNYSFGPTSRPTCQGITMASTIPQDVLVTDRSIPGFDSIDNGVVTQVKMNTPGGQASPAYLTLNSTGSSIFISSGGSVYQYTYPSMTLTATYNGSSGQFTGVATSPSGNYF